MEFLDFHPPPEDFAKEVLEGLRRPFKSLPPKFFYDRAGSDLFLRITRLPEYYLTRVEKDLLPVAAADLRKDVGPGTHVIEYGCGNSGKVQILLNGLKGAASYLGVEIARSHLLEFCGALAVERPGLTVRAVCADFTEGIGLDGILPGEGRRLAFFPGSSIGNFDPGEAVKFLANVRETVGGGGGLLIGVDLKKSPEVLNAAYNDAEGVTARFNLNLLRRINREARANFRLSRFRHRAFWNEEAGRIEMHLESLEDQTVSVADVPIPFRKGETIHTENSYKYAEEEFQKLSRTAGWEPERLWKDAFGLFSLHYLVNRNGREAREAANFRKSDFLSPALALTRA